MKRIFTILMIVVVFIFGLIWLTHRARTRATNSGKAVVRNQAAAISSPGTPVSAPAGQKSQPAAASPSAAPAADSALTPPAADSIPRNPPSGTVFAGKGKFQLYRQGDITWRLDTDSGGACILFATDAQWSRPQVYSHGCGPA
jgi:cytoskeletal protein RodZ